MLWQNLDNLLIFAMSRELSMVAKIYSYATDGIGNIFLRILFGMEGRSWTDLLYLYYIMLLPISSNFVENILYREDYCIVVLIRFFARY